jgi:carboxyl-terminal processing protease
MKKLGYLKVNRLQTTLFLSTAFLLFTPFSRSLPSQATPDRLQTATPNSITLEPPFVKPNSPNAKELVDKTWQIVNENYIDPKFNGQNWPAVRQQYLTRSYSSTVDAYKAIKTMLQLLGDRYTRFMSPEEFKNAQRLTSGESGSIGLQLLRDKQTNHLVIGLGNASSPAFESGLLPGDVLLSIDGQTTQDLPQSEATGLLWGVAGTPVVLQIRRGQQNLKFTVKRSNQKLPSLDSSAQTTALGKVGYIRFLAFAADSSNTMRTAIRNLENEPITGYILDLRANSGGLLRASVEIAQMWLQSGTIFSMAGRRGEAEHEQANRTALTDKPLVVIVDGHSAAASEILASALQENRRAVVVGTSTYGQNSIQSVRPLDGGAGLAVTVAKWLTPKGKDIEKTGVVPDVVVNLTLTQQQDLIRQHSLGTLADPQYAKALQVLSQPVKSAK